MNLEDALFIHGGLKRKMGTEFLTQSAGTGQEVTVLDKKRVDSDKIQRRNFL